MKWVMAILGIIAILLGGLWFLQGTGIVVIAPIACVGECGALEGPSLPWAISGAAMIIAGTVALLFALRAR
ncbi:MAG TPA: hypothetical protein VL133_00380 [Devosia sp.]|nr:hypothetical protein [Devosia sp.]